MAKHIIRNGQRVRATFGVNKFSKNVAGKSTESGQRTGGWIVMAKSENSWRESNRLVGIDFSFALKGLGFFCDQPRAAHVSRCLPWAIIFRAYSPFESANIRVTAVFPWAQRAFGCCRPAGRRGGGSRARASGAFRAASRRPACPSACRCPSSSSRRNLSRSVRPPS
jgi:hypothetical protein